MSVRPSIPEVCPSVREAKTREPGTTVGRRGSSRRDAIPDRDSDECDPSTAGALIGAFLAVAGGLWLKRHDERRTARAVRVQFVRLLALVRAAIAPFADDEKAPMALLADPSIAYLRERAFSADAGLALTERENRLVHEALRQLLRSTDHIEERRRAAGPEGSRPILAVIQNFHEIPDAAREAIIQLDAAVAEIETNL